MNKSQNKWLKHFIHFFDLEKYQESICIESLRILKIYHATGKFKNNPKLLAFMENGWFNEFIKTADKKIYLMRFAKIYKKHTKLDPQRARRDLTPCNALRKHSSQPLIFNTIKVRQMRKRGLKKSTCISIKPIIISYRKKIWLSIGIDDYQGLPKLSNAVNDAIQIGKFAQEKLDFISIVLKNEQGTKINIEKQIKKVLYQICTNNDLIVISFHGHGETLEINGKSHGFIVPFLESTYSKNPFELISMQELCQWSNYFAANHVLFIMDCCFSGFTAMRGAKKKTVKDSNFTNTSVKKMLSRKARVVINAGTDDQVISDGGWGNNSILTGLIISYPFYHKTLGSSFHLYNYLLEQVPKRNPSQTPTIGKLNGDMGGDVFLAL